MTRIGFTTVVVRPGTCGKARWVVERFLLIGVAVLFTRTWLLQGLLVPFEVNGGSMAETLLGEHWQIVCEDCGLRFVCGSDTPAVTAQVTCPNCGFAKNDLEQGPSLAGDRLMIDRASLTPQLFELAQRILRLNIPTCLSLIINPIQDPIYTPVELHIGRLFVLAPQAQYMAVKIPTRTT